MFAILRWRTTHALAIYTVIRCLKSFFWLALIIFLVSFFGQFLVGQFFGFLESSFDPTLFGSPFFDHFFERFWEIDKNWIFPTSWKIDLKNRSTIIGTKSDTVKKKPSDSSHKEELPNYLERKSWIGVSRDNSIMRRKTSNWSIMTKTDLFSSIMPPFLHHAFLSIWNYHQAMVGAALLPQKMHWEFVFEGSIFWGLKKKVIKKWQNCIIFFTGQNRFKNPEKKFGKKLFRTIRADGSLRQGARNHTNDERTRLDFWRHEMDTGTWLFSGLLFGHFSGPFFWQPFFEDPKIWRPP